MGVTKNLTLQASVTKTAAFTGSWVGIGIINKPVSAGVAANAKATFIVRVSALTGKATFRLVGKDPLSGQTFDIPNGAMPVFEETGILAIPIEGPFPDQVACAVAPELSTGTPSVTYTASLQTAD